MKFVKVLAGASMVVTAMVMLLHGHGFEAAVWAIVGACLVFG